MKKETMKEIKNEQKDNEFKGKAGNEKSKQLKELGRAHTKAFLCLWGGDKRQQHDSQRRRNRGGAGGSEVSGRGGGRVAENKKWRVLVEEEWRLGQGGWGEGGVGGTRRENSEAKKGRQGGEVGLPLLGRERRRGTGAGWRVGLPLLFLFSLLPPLHYYYLGRDGGRVGGPLLFVFHLLPPCKHYYYLETVDKISNYAIMPARGRRTKIIKARRAPSIVCSRASWSWKPPCKKMEELVLGYDYQALGSRRRAPATREPGRAIPGTTLISRQIRNFNCVCGF